MTADVELLPCGECGMPCRAGEYHPFAACLMFKACHNSETVRANLAPLQAENERLRAEVERLRADRDSWEQQASDRVADWHAEHLRAERLRAEVAEWKRVAAAQGELHREAEDRADKLAEALRDAATSMQTIADKAGRDEYLMTTDEVRGYANSRANAARAALEQEAGRG